MDYNFKRINTATLATGGLIVSVLFMYQNKKINKLKIDNFNLNKDIEDVSIKNRSITAELEKERKINLILKSELNKIQNDEAIVNYKEDINKSLKTKELYIKIDDLSQTISNKNLEIKNLKNQLNSLENNYKKSIQSKNDELHALKYEVESLKNDLNISSKSESLNYELEEKIITLKSENKAFKVKCDGQTEKIRELKNQIREYTSELSLLKEELSVFKEQVKEVIDAKNKEDQVIKDLSRTADRVSKKVNKSGGK